MLNGSSLDTLIIIDLQPYTVYNLPILKKINNSKKNKNK